MAIRVVRLGEPRAKNEGLRIGTVRRPPRGVPKNEYAARDWYDVWLPNLAPGAETVKSAQAAATPAQWTAFTKKYRAEMARPENRRVIDLLAALSHHANFSVGCYCADETRCHRSVLRALLEESGARMSERREAQARRARPRAIAPRPTNGSPHDENDGGGRE